MAEYRKNHGKMKQKNKNRINEYYDYDFTKRILKLSDLDPYFAIKEIGKYINEYTYDYNLQCAYGSLLITIGEFEKAQKYNDALMKKVLDTKYLFDVKNGEKMKRLIANLKFCKFRILSNTGQYQKAYDFLLSNKEEFEKNEVLDFKVNYNIELYYRTRLGWKYNRDNVNSYIYKQIVEYDEEDFFEHIKKHIKGLQETDSESLFFEDIDVRKIYSEIKKILPNATPMYRGFIDKTYYFKYDTCGIEKKEVTDFIKLVTFGDDKGAITMCPTREGENLQYIDINYLKTEEKTKTKKLSQIDKFNQKYNKK